MIKKIFIHTNEKQLIGAKVSQYSFEKKLTDKNIEVNFIKTSQYPFLIKKEGKLHLRKGIKSIWRNDLQNFTPLRFLAAELMNFEGRALVIDPDVFANVDASPLFEMDMRGKSILARKIRSNNSHYWASSVMLLDCAKLKHWKWQEDFQKLFTFERDYRSWMNLEYEDQSSIGELEKRWNDFDHLDNETCFLHTTSRITQPWKTGLPIDFSVSEKTKPKTLLSNISYKLGFKIDFSKPKDGHYLPHPDKSQEKFFYTLLKEAIDSGIISNNEINDAIKAKNVRPDSFDILKSV
jgi:hypothetical protein